MTTPTSVSLPGGISSRLLSNILGFGVAFALGAAPFLGAKRIPGFEPLIAIFPEKYRNLLIAFSSLLMGAVALAVQFFAGKAITRHGLKRGFVPVLLVMVAGVLALLILYVSYVVAIPNPVFGGDDLYIIGWSRLPSCKCGSDADCIEGFAQDLASCWRGITQVKLALFFSYLIAIEGFAVLAGLLTLQQEKIRPPRRTAPRKRTKSKRAPEEPKP